MRGEEIPLTTSVPAPAGFTTIPVCDAVSDAFETSVTVTDCVPAVFRVTPPGIAAVATNVWSPVSEAVNV